MVITNRIIFRFSFLFMFFFLSFAAVAQQSQKYRCGTYHVTEEIYRKHPGLRERLANERKIVANQTTRQQSNIQARNNSTLTIPLVIHVVLPNPNIISNNQILSQIEVLNTDFAGLNQDSTRIPSAFKPFFGKGRIRFCLDTINAIIRKTSNTKSVSGQGDPIKYSNQGGSDAWDPRKYLNIWICEFVNSKFIGYSFTPSIDTTAVPIKERGFVNNYRYFGKGPTVEAPYNLGRTALHELGHFFDLEHIWGLSNCDGSDNCGDDDGINDTPKQEKCNYGAPLASTIIKDACTTTEPGIMWMNYMDYVDDVAMVMFTPEQHLRMEASLSSYVWMQGLANNNLCSSAQIFERDIRLVSLNNSLGSAGSSNQYICTGNFRPNITVQNTGSTTIISLRIETSINNGNPVVTNWSGTLPVNGVLSINLNPISVNPGTNPNFKIEIKQVNGQSDQNTINNTYTTPALIYPITLNLPLNEGFEQTPFPSNNWRLSNPENDYTWERTTTAFRQGSASMFFNNFDAENYDHEDLLITPLIPAKGRDSIFVRFFVAAATYSQPSLINEPTDSLHVLVTGDCGSTYDVKYRKGGIGLVTTGDISISTPFIPLTSQWRRDSVFIGYYDNNAVDYIQIAFKNINNFENNIYIDDISIYNRIKNPQSSVNDIYRTGSKKMTVYPNPFSNQIIVDFKENFNLKHPFRIVNVFGQEITKGIFTETKTVIDLKSLPAGIYFLHIKEEMVKLIKR